MLADATVAARGPRNVAAVVAGLAGARQNAVVLFPALPATPPVDRLQRQLAADGERGRSRGERTARSCGTDGCCLSVPRRSTSWMLSAVAAAQVGASASAAASVRDSRRRGAGRSCGSSSPSSGTDEAVKAARAAGRRRSRR